MSPNNQYNVHFLDDVFHHLLDISNGRCRITDDIIMNESDPMQQKILLGLLQTHEDLELSKEDFKKKVEYKYQVKVLEEKNKELEQIAYITSHDLQEPLKTLTNFTHLFTRQYKDQLDEQAQLYLKYIGEASKRMSLLIKHLLDYSRLGKVEDLEQVDCEKLIIDTLFDLQVLVETKKASIHYSNLPTIKGYSTQLRLVFQNLINNGIKFHKKDERPIININVRKINSNWEFSVKDNGIGIDPVFFNKIFLIFNRLHTENEYKGTGIGLAQCKKIIELHKGNIWVESTPNEGTCVYFTIPCNLEI